MTTEQIDAYLEGVPEPQRATLRAVRETIAGLLPEAEQTISYGIPTFKQGGKGVAGLGHSKDSCSYYPMSGSVIASLGDQLAGFVTSKGAVQFPSDQPLDPAVVQLLVEARQAEIASGRG